MRDPILGIDLGTSSTVVAYADGTGDVQVLADEGGTKLHPSVVAFHPNGGVVVGAAAKQRKVIDPQNTIYSVKRLLGRGFRSPEVQTAMARVPFLIKAGESQLPMVVTRSGELAIPEISAIVLDHVRTIAAARLGTEVARAVITVPASGGDAQRSATATAGALAGLTVVRVLSEPTAAALAYGHARALADVIAVYDFGGGTFDVSILRRADQVYEVLGTAGDAFLGGDDLDERLVDRMAAKFLAEHRIDLRADEIAMMRLRAVAEQTKIELSRRARAVVRVDELAIDPRGAPLHLQIEISRDELVRDVADLVERTFPICRDALATAGVSAEQISDVLMVGGTTKMPYVREQVGRFFGKPPRIDLPPEEAVAIGAALQGAALEEILARPRPGSRPLAVPRPESRGGEETTATGTATLEPGTGLEDARRPASEPTVTQPGTAYSVTRGGSKDTYEGRPPTPTPAPGAGGFEERTPLPQGVPLARVGRPGTADAAAPPPPPPPGAALGKTVLGVPAARPETAQPPPIPRSAAARGAPAPRIAGPASSTLDIPTLHGGTEPGFGAGAQASAAGAQPGAAARLPNPASWSDVGGPVRPPVPAPGTAGAAPAAPRPPPPPATHAPPGAPVVLEVTPRGLGIGTVAGYCEELIRRNSRLPAAAKKLFTTARDRQDVVRIVICQGESRRLDHNTVIGDLVLQGLPPRPRGETSIEVTFSLDVDGILQVEARDALTGTEQRAELDLRGSMQPQDGAASRDRVQQLRR